MGIFQLFISLFVYKASNIANIKIRQNLVSLEMANGIASKLGSVIEFLSGQQKITETNIEATLKV
jgi:hypothetical protein